MAEYELNGVRLTVPDAVLSDKIAAKLANGRYEANEAKAAQMRLRPGKRVLELGAGLGYIASLCAGITGPENVMTVEANPDMLEVIRNNLDQNGFQAASLIHGAVGKAVKSNQAVGFEEKPAFWAGRLADQNSKPEAIVNVPLLSLHTLLRNHRPHVVIMDIEGAEQHLFDLPWPGFVQNVIMELHPGQYSDHVIKKIVDCMSTSGLTYDPGPSRGRVMGFRKLREK